MVLNNMNWLKENWFKIALLIILLFMTGFLVYYLQSNKNQNSKAEEVKNSKLLDLEAENPIPQAQSPTITTTKSSDKVSEDSSIKVLKQLNDFENYFEGILLDSYISCSTLGAYNYFEDFKDSEFMSSSFPESKGYYATKCQSEYLSASQQGSRILVAEPALVELRKKISSFLEVVRTLAPLVLEGRNSTNELENAQKKLRTEIREEIISLRKIYR